MNTFRTISRVLVIATVVFAGNASAGEKGNAPKWFSFDRDDLKQGFKDKVNTHKFTFIAAQVSDKVGRNNFEKAGIDTLGVAADKTHGSKSFGEAYVTVHPTALGTNFATNLAIREASDYAHSKGFTFDLVAKKCDVLPEGTVRDVVNPVARTIAEQATKPQALTLAALYALSIIFASDN